MLLRALPVLLIIALGALAGRLKVHSDPNGTIAALNKFAFYFAFPALIVAGLADPALQPPTEAGFYVAHGISFALVVLVVMTVTSISSLRGARGVVLLCTVFGNIAYLGIPVLRQFFGEGVTGLASVSASLHVVMAMTIGPMLFYAFGNPEEGGAGGAVGALRRVVKQPLVWSPAAGLALRMVPDPFATLPRQFCETLGGAAGPVALYMLGLYLWVSRRALKGAQTAAFTTVAAKLIVYPLVTFAVVVALPEGLKLAPVEALVVIMMAAMPTAVTTFSIAEDAGRGKETAAAAILASTLISMVLLPVLGAAVSVYFGLM